MEIGVRRRYWKTFADEAVDLTIAPGVPFKLIDVKFLLETAASTSESVTIDSKNAEDVVFHEITATQGNFLTSWSGETTPLYRFDKQFPGTTSIEIDYANTADHCDDITVEVVIQLQDTSVVDEVVAVS